MTRMIQVLFALSLILGFIPLSNAFAVTQVTKVEYSDPGQVTITGDGKLNFEKTVNAQDKQIIIEIKDAQVASGAGEKIDTSSSKGMLSQVSPYQVEGKDTVRVVLQLRGMVDANITQDGNVLKVSVPTSAGANAPSTTTAEAPPPAEVGTPAAKNDKLDEFFENQTTKRFIGKHITLQFRDADAVDVFRLIGEASGFNIVLGSDVSGKVTLSLVDVPWDLALDTLLTSLRLGAERSNNVLRISSLSSLTSEKQEELRAKQASQATAVRVTKIFSISYAKPSDLLVILKQFGSASPASLGGPGIGGSATNIIVDERTNSIIVQDTPDNIERMKKLIALLDTQTPQILIEAKVIEATESFGKTIGGSIGGGRSSSEQAVASFNGSNPVDPLIGSASSIFPNGSSVATASANSGALGLSNILNGPTFGLFSGLRITSLLNIGESESQIKIVSSPKLVVLNKQAANIVQGTPVLVPGTTTQNGVTIPANTVQSANLSLTVTPTVTNDGNIMMDLGITNNIPIPFAGGLGGVGTRSITSKVVSESGATLVIGGIFNDRVSHNESGFPFLRKIPILGHLFGSEADSTDRSELFIFITPRILNEKESGLSG